MGSVMLEDMSRALNRASLSNLNCMEGVRCPVSYELQSKDLMPTDGLEPGLVSVTLRQNGQVRMVHGNAELAGAIRKGVGEVLEGEEGKQEPVEKNATWIWSLGDGVFGAKRGLKVCCKLLESCLSAGWEVVASSDVTVTPGFEMVTWVLKKSAAKPASSEVVCVVLKAPNRLEIVGVCDTEPVKAVAVDALKAISVQYEDAVDKVAKEVVKPAEEAKPAAAPAEEKKEGEEAKEPTEEAKKEEGGEEEKAKEAPAEEKPAEAPAPPKPAEAAEPAEPVIEYEDVPVPGAYDMDMNALNADGGHVIKSRLLLKLTHALFVRQYRFLASASVPYAGDNEVMFFAKDGRILPGLGQESFAMMELEKPDVMRLYGLGEDAEKDLIKVVIDSWAPGMESKEPTCVGEVKQYKLLETPWSTRESKRATSGNIQLATQNLLSRCLLALNKRELNLFARVTIGRLRSEQRTLLIFRQSNIAYTEALTLKLTGLNKIAVLGGGEDDVKAIRNCLQSRWPYPLTHDYEMIRDESVGGEGWYFKVKRYPWAVSYGNKHVDRAIESTKELLAKQPKIQVPNPGNMDAESAKSLLVFLIKDLGDLGWRLQTTADVCSQMVSLPVRIPGPERPNSAHSIFLLK